MSSTTVQRIESIDVAKGIGMLLVIYSHIPWQIGGNDSYPGLDFILSFHMPLFMLLSGMFYSSNMNFRDFLVKKICTLLLPFCIFLLVLCCLVPLCADILNGGGNDIRIYNPIRIVYIERGIGPIWFLYSLFLINLIAYGVDRMRVIIKISMLVMIGIMIVAIYCNYLKLPFFLDSSIALFPFFYIGRYIRKYWFDLERNILVIVILALCTLLLTYSLQAYISYAWCIFKTNVLCVLVLGLSGTLFTLSISALLKNDKILQFVGKHTLCLMCIHLPVITLLAPFANLYIDNIHIRMALIFLCTPLLSLPLSLLIEKILPMCAGKYKFISHNK